MINRIGRCCLITLCILLASYASNAQGRTVHGPIECSNRAAGLATENGFKYADEGRHDKALVEYEKAVRAEPNCAAAYNNLGTGYFHLGLHADAIAAYQFALRFNPSWAWIPNFNIGRSLSILDRLDAAARAYGEAIRLNPKDGSAYRSRAGVLLRQGKGELATADARTFLKMEGWRNRDSVYAVLLAYLGHRKASQNNEADSILDEFVLKGKKSDWPFPVLRYLRKEINEQELLGLSTDIEKMTEARAYIGMSLALSGRNSEAQDHFEWVRVNGKKSYFEFHLALSELRRLAETR